MNAKLLRILRLGVIIIATIGLGMWLVGRVVSDRYLWSQFLLWIPTPAALLLACIGLLFSFRSPRRSGINLTAIGYGVSLVLVAVYFSGWEYQLLDSDPNGKNGWEVVHFNASWPGPQDVERVGRFLIDLDADVTILTEPGYIHRSEQLAVWLGEARLIRRSHFAILTRLTVTHARVVLAADGISVVLLKIRLPDSSEDAEPLESHSQPITLLLIDLPSSPLRPRMAVMRDLHRRLNKLDLPTPDIALGDFNIPRCSASLDLLPWPLQNAYNLAGQGYSATFPRSFPLYHIDQMFLNDTLRAVEYEILDTPYGRHKAQRMIVQRKY